MTDSTTAARDNIMDVPQPLLQGLSALITGSASGLRGSLRRVGKAGIGYHTACAFAKHGVSRLALVDYDLPALTASVDKLRGDWPETEFLPLEMDVRKPEQVKDAFSKVILQFGRLDVAVNNAGVIGHGTSTHEESEDEWQRVVDINLNGVFRCQKEEIAHMMRQTDLGARRGRGTIVNVASMYGIVGPPTPVHAASYAAAKHGVMGLTKADANAYADSHIRVNAICPGYTATKLLEGPPNGEAHSHLRDHIARTPMKRMAMPDEVADSIVFLASSMSSFMHGAALIVDGGFTSN
ncbi:hypothetical protein HIM_05333 [Hirsutella minnesotensis 3608]|uniref:Uncharacterized protein n=1 Tax=Hirsutella minnesotensis 3608 TaxID=1043627 RepID=A0A0F8A0K2_9HYPO|nr:hypothetical protein HIM_05333 [Hirsutella minnesotensis 3608]